ncbi:glycoside hydrolase family 25 protein [Kitasatospora kifunensis]|uniref:Hydrolase n=1 Tax=Kitasatospora kifunensis TaxID=58351 RepID=A0A7W7VTH1_KITKI|nr:glycoside hydrolase family 25 protein [Kitasatospora kifunensis]MBB4922291.1 hypothetical protein [Kitasatospora kifunensis]
MGIYGQDWASYQSAMPDTTGLSFAFVKITEGLSYINPLWQQQRDHAKANGLVWGAYHYPHMHNSDRAEADFFLAQNVWQPGDMVVLDWEGYDAANASVSTADQLAYKEDYLTYVKSKLPNNPVGLYCNTDYWNRVDTTGHRGDFLWIATSGLPAGQPGIRASWLFHQYSDSGSADQDYCPLGSTAELRSWALSFQPPPPPAPAPQSQPAPAPAPTPQGEEMASLPIPFGFAFDPSGALADSTKMLATPVPELGGPRINYRLVDLSLGCDMGSMRVRIAIHNEQTGWAANRIWQVDLQATDKRYPIWLQNGDDKISIGRVPMSASDTKSDKIPASLLIEPVLA